MDPVTITATVITFATAVKDLVELGQKIHESFAKVSKNRRSAQRVAENVKDMIDEIVVFCEEHKDTVANMKEFTVALDALLKKLRLFEAAILPLVPQRGGSWISVSFLRGWWNNNKVKDGILDLEGEIREVRRRYVMKSAMRTEVKLEVVHQDATRNFADISHGLELVRTDVHAIRVSTTVAPIAPTTLGTTDERERNVMLFVRSAMSNSTSLLRPPDEVTEEVWTTVFIKKQVHYIAEEVAKISTLRIFDESLNAMAFNAKPFGVTFTDDSMAISSSCLRRNVVRKLMDLHDVLPASGGLQEISVHRAAAQLNNLCWGLSALGLEEESELFLDWAIKLARALVNTPGLRGEAQHRTSLALYLHRLVQGWRDTTQRQQAIEESLSITQTLLSLDCTNTEIQGLRAEILMHHSQYAPDNESAIIRCMQAIQLLEDIFQVKTLVRVDLYGTTGAVTDSSYDLVNHVFSLSPTPMMIEGCADAFQCLAVYTLRAGKSDNAKRLAHLCIALKRRMVLAHGNENEPRLAETLSSICRGELARCFADIELLDMVDECALLFRQLTENNPVYYSQPLLHILWKRAEILDQLNRHSDSISTREEAVSLAGQIIQDFGLQATALFWLARGLRNANRYLEAARAMARIPAIFWNELHGSFYGSLAHDLITTRHYAESAEVAKNSVSIFRKVVLKRPEAQWTSDLVYALRALAQSLIYLGDKSQGLMTLDECMSIVTCILAASLDTDTLPAKLELEQYLDALQMYFITQHLADKGPQITEAHSALQQLDSLSRRHPQTTSISRALWQLRVHRANNLYCAGYLADGHRYISQWHDSSSGRKVHQLKAAFTPFLAQLVWIKAYISDAQGDAEHALVAIQNFQSVPQLPIDGLDMVVSVVLCIRLHIALGKFGKAVQVARHAMNLSRFSPVEHHPKSIWALYGLGYAALVMGDYQRAMECCIQGIEMSDDPQWRKSEDEFNSFIRPALFSLMSSAEGNTGRLSRALDYAQQAVTLALDLAERVLEISSTTAEQSYIEARGYLAEVLLATGDLKQTRQICDERRAYFTQRVSDRMGEYRDIAPILRMLGVLCCHEGRHDEGEAAARELTEIINRLGLVFPSLQEQVKIRLRYQASVPILQILDEMTDKLACKHQKGILALFKE